jgi:hypothetical protein
MLEKFTKNTNVLSRRHFMKVCMKLFLKYIFREFLFTAMTGDEAEQSFSCQGRDEVLNENTLQQHLSQCRGVESVLSASASAPTTTLDTDGIINACGPGAFNTDGSFNGNAERLYSRIQTENVTNTAYHPDGTTSSSTYQTSTFIGGTGTIDLSIPPQIAHLFAWDHCKREFSLCQPYMNTEIHSREADVVEDQVRALLEKGLNDSAKHVVLGSTFSQGRRDLFRSRGVEYKRANDSHVRLLAVEAEFLTSTLQNIPFTKAEKVEREQPVTQLYALISETEKLKLSRQNCESLRLIFLHGANVMRLKSVRTYPDSLTENRFICETLNSQDNDNTEAGSVRLDTPDAHDAKLHGKKLVSAVTQALWDAIYANSRNILFVLLAIVAFFFRGVLIALVKTLVAVL